MGDRWNWAGGHLGYGDGSAWYECSDHDQAAADQYDGDKTTPPIAIQSAAWSLRGSSDTANPSENRESRLATEKGAKTASVYHRCDWRESGGEWNYSLFFPRFRDFFSGLTIQQDASNRDYLEVGAANGNGDLAGVEQE